MQKHNFSTGRIFRPMAAASFLGLGKTTLYMLVNTGKLPKPIKLGVRARGWSEETLLHFIQMRLSNAASYDEYINSLGVPSYDECTKSRQNAV